MAFANAPNSMTRYNFCKIHTKMYEMITWAAPSSVRTHCNHREGYGLVEGAKPQTE